MKRFLGFVIKEFYHIFRDRRTLLILFGMPIAQMMIFGYAISNEIKDVKIAVLDKSRDAVTRKITDKITSSGYFKLYEIIDNEKEIEQYFRQGKVKEVIVFEENFASKIEKEKKASVHLIVDASDANTANLIINYTSGIIADYLKKENVNISTPMQIIVESRMLYNEALKSVYMFVPGTTGLILMLISALMTSISIVREKETGTMEVLLVSPLKPIQIIIGKVTPYVLLSFINAITILILSYFVFGLPVKGNIILLLGECILFIIMALSLGIFISTATSSQQVAIFISMFTLMLPTVLLSGFIYPIENMPLILQWLCQIMPPKWFIIIIKNIMIKGTGFSYVWKETLVLIGMVCLFIFMSVKRFKIRTE